MFCSSQREREAIRIYPTSLFHTRTSLLIAIYHHYLEDDQSGSKYIIAMHFYFYTHNRIPWTVDCVVLHVLIPFIRYLCLVLIEATTCLIQCHVTESREQYNKATAHNRNMHYHPLTCGYHQYLLRVLGA